MRVLVVEDEPRLAEGIGEWLRAEAHAVDVVGDGEAALERVGWNDYDVVVLNRDLPVVPGDDVCRELVAVDGGARVLLLTAAADAEGSAGSGAAGAAGAAACRRAAGSGAVDYLAKPFALPELAARVRELGRRGRPAAPTVLRRADLTLDLVRREAFRGGRRVPLSRKEFGVLAELLRGAGAAVPTERLLERVWDGHADPFTGAVRLAVLRLRRKLGDPPVVETVTGVGYRIR